jgi:hypothetical protein
MRPKGLILRPFDKLKVLSEVEAQTQDGDSSTLLTVPEQSRRELAEP